MKNSLPDATEPANVAVPAGSDRRGMMRRWFPALVLAAAVVVAYAPAFRCDYVWDDDVLVTENVPVLHDAGLRDIWLKPGSTVQYYPLVFSSFWLERKIWGIQPFTLHLVNILLHAVAAILVWRILRRLAVPGALFAAALFALHPVHVESVAWITERKNCLSGVFYLGAAWAYVRFALDDALPRARSHRFYVLAFFLFVCALLSKTVTCSLPAAMLLLVWWKRGRLAWRDVAPTLPMFLVGLGLALQTVWLEKHSTGAQGAEWELSLLERGVVAGRALWFYAGKLAWPADLTFIYPRWNVSANAPGPYLFPASALACVAALFFLRNRLGRGPLTAVLFFAGTLTPALAFFDVYPMRYSFVADHFQYLASLGLIALAAGTAAALTARRPLPARAAAAALLLVLGVLTWRQCRAYRDHETLWQDTIRKNPRCWLAKNNLGTLYNDRGDVEKAERHFRSALADKPDYVEALSNLGTVLSRRGRIPEALALYTQALQTDPASAHAHYNFGETLERQGDLAAAETHYRAALRADPNLPQALNNLGNVLAARGRVAEAVATYRRALAVRPRFADVHSNLAILLAGEGLLDEAIAHYGEALRVKPHLAETHNNLALALDKAGRPAEARQHFLEAVRLAPQSATVRLNFANHLAERGDLPAAEEQCASALAGNPDDTRARIVLASILSRTGRSEKALTVLAEALRDQQTARDRQLRLAEERTAQQDLAGAEICRRRAADLTRGEAEIHHRRAQALARQGKTDAAIEACRTAVKLDPGVERYLFDLGNFLAEKGDPDGAASAFEAALRVNPRSAPAHNGLGVALAKQGLLNAARTHIEQALRLAPRFEDAQQNLKTVQEWIGQVENEIARLQALAARESANPKPRKELGAIFGRMGRAAEAYAALSKAAELDPADAETQNNLGVVAGHLGRYEEAVRRVERALELKPDYPEAQENLRVLRRRASASPAPAPAPAK